MKNLTIVQKSIIIFIAAAIVGFCIITNSSGVYRSYLAEDLPLVIDINENSPLSYDSVLEDAINTWNSVEGSFFEFQVGSRVSNSDNIQDGVNLFYVDDNNENFEPESNTIAFSMTYASNAGGFHAVESDYIYNAAGFPPATDGSQNQMDLMTITLHEFGHHLGLSHNGPDGNSSGGSEGCGLSLPNSVMYYAVSLGQIQHELDPHAGMGAVAIYPNYVLEIQVTDASTNDPIENAKIVLNNSTIAAITEPVEDSPNGRGGLVPGEVYTEFSTPSNGFVKAAMNKKEFSFDLMKFGYDETEETIVSFEESSGYGDTQILSYNFRLNKSQVVGISGSIVTTTPEIELNAIIAATWVNDENETFSSTTDANGNFSLDVPSGSYYNIEVFYDPPYQYVQRFDSVFVSPEGLDLNLQATPSNLIIVNSEDSENSNFSIYLDKLEDYQIPFAFWNEMERGNLSEQSFISSLIGKYSLVWIAGGESSSGLDDSDIEFLKSHLESGSGLVLTGNNIAENVVDQGVSETFLSDYFGVEFAQNITDIRLKGFKNDLIGDGIAHTIQGLDKDLLQLTDSNLGEIYKSFYIGTTNVDTANIVGVRSESEEYGWRAFFLSSAAHNVFGSVFDSILVRSIGYVLDTNFVTSVDYATVDELPNVYSIAQNYPNPFNPSTTIKFNLPVNANVKLTIYNILGEQVDVLKDDFLSAGSYEMRWDAVSSSLSSGIYFYNIKAEGINGSNYNQTRKMILLK